MNSNECFPVEYNDDLRAILEHLYTEYVEEGGRGSCKSSFISIAAMLLLDSNKNYNAFVGRKVADTMQDSVYEQLLWAIEKLKLRDWVGTVKPLKIRNKRTKQAIIFRGADKAEKTKSIKLHHGYFAITWLEEVTEYTPKDVNDITISTMRGGDKYWCFYSFNPPSAVRNWCNTELKKPTPRRLVHHTDFRCVPKAWLGDAFFDKAKEMKETNSMLYRNIYLGEVTGNGRNIFENVILREITDEEIESWDWHNRGVDFGYYPDAFRYNATYFDYDRRILYIFDELNLLKHGNWEASEKLKEHLIEFYKLKKDEPLFFMEDEMIGDSAEPKSIADYRQWGWNIKGAIKGKGSLDAGMKWLQSLRAIIIDEVRAPKAADEFTKYEYEIDRKTGEVMSGYPQNQPDHSIANVRYQTEKIWRQRGV